MDTKNFQATLKSLKPPRLNGLTRQDLKSYFDNTWKLYEMLFSSLTLDETLYQRPDPLRNPLIFYLGHTAAFYINKLKMAGLIDKGVNERFDHLFAVGVDPDTPEDLEVSDYWPTVAETRNYRKTIYAIVQKVIDRADLSKLPINQHHPLWALMMAFEHDRVHFETSSMLIRQLDADLLTCPDAWRYAPTYGHPQPNSWIHMAGGEIQFGKPYHSDLYGWDHEFGTQTVTLSAFAATQNLITNAEFWDFVNAGGYEDSSFWTKEGWDWKTRTNTKSPKFWVPFKTTYHYRAMFDHMPMPMDWPVEVNAHEARAYCTWKNDGSRLLSEAEFLFIAREEMEQSDDPLFCNDHNLNLVYGSPTPVGHMKTGATASGFNDIYGNVWDWLSDDFYPLQGYKIHSLYKDFSKPYMDNEHSMLGGGAWITTGTAACRYYRLWFRRHFFQHAGFRLAKNL